MSLRLKIFLLCIAVYVITLVITGVVITEDSYQSMLKTEVERCLSEQSNMYSTVVFYLVTNQKYDQKKIAIEGYGQNLVDMVESQDVFIELLTTDMKPIASNYKNKSIAVSSRNELNETLKENRSYILRRIEGNHQLFISDIIKIDEQKMIMTVIKDITHIDQQKKNLYAFFIQIGIIGMIVVTIITAIMSKFVTRRIEILESTAGSIAEGNYSERVHVKGSDEVGKLANQFNLMACEVQKRIDELQKEAERKQRFMDNLTHEFRTPLTSIIGFSEFLMTVKHDEGTYHKSMGYINSEGNRMLKMVGQLMDMILLRQNSLITEKQSTNILFNEVIDIIKSKADNKKIILKIEGQDAQLNIDRDMIKGVMINLIDNAINASESGTTVVMGTETSEDSICVYVKDNGKGLEASEINKVIEPFYRVDKSRSRKEGGLGLGLSVCNEIVKAHGAKLEIESVKGKGTIVKVFF